jgi:O-antigen/teichoic acid export membrane protein
MSALRKLASQTAIYGLTSMARLVYSLLLVPLQTAVCSRAEYGVVSNLYAYIPFFTALLTLGMETAYFRFASDREDQNKVYGTAYITILIAALSFLGLSWIFQDPLSSLLHYESNPEYIQLTSLILCLDLIAAIPFVRLRQQNKPIRFATARIINMATVILVNVFFLWFCPLVLEGNIYQDYLPLVKNIYFSNNPVLYVFLANLFGSVIQLLFLLPELMGFKYGFDKTLWKDMFRYGWPMMLVGLAGMVNETLDRAIIPYLIPDRTLAEEQLGVYGACYKLSIFLTVFVQAFRFAAEPFFFNKAKDKDAKQTYVQVMDWFVLVCACIFLGINLFIDVAKLYIDEKFWDGLHVVPILLLANLFLGVYVNLSVWYKLTNKTKIGSLISLGGALLTIILLFSFVPSFGYTAAAWTTLICYFCMAVVGYFTGRKYFPVPYHIFQNLIYIFGALFIYLLSLKFDEYLYDPVYKNLAHTYIFLIYFVMVTAYQLRSDKRLLA